MCKQTADSTTMMPHSPVSFETAQRYSNSNSNSTKRPLLLSSTPTPTKRRRHCRRLPISKHRLLLTSSNHQRTSNPPRRVRFAVTEQLVRVKEIHNLLSFTAEEKQRTWWTRQEVQKFRSREKERQEIETLMKKEIEEWRKLTTKAAATEKQRVEESEDDSTTKTTDLSTTNQNSNGIVLQQQMKWNGQTTRSPPKSRRRIIIKKTNRSGQRVLIKTRRPLSVVVH